MIMMNTQNSLVHISTLDYLTENNPGIEEVIHIILKRLGILEVHKALQCFYP